MMPTDPSLPGTPPLPPSFTAPSGEDFAELVKSVRSLRLLLNLAVVTLLLFIVILNAFMLFRVHSMRRQGADLQSSVVNMQKVVTDYETNSVPVMQRFTLDLRRFSERNPDFAPILNRYSAAMPSTKSTSAPPQAPVVTTAPGKK